jgi:LPXTG-site transpeptidase (sortase) family protein
MPSLPRLPNPQRLTVLSSNHGRQALLALGGAALILVLGLGLALTAAPAWTARHSTLKVSGTSSATAPAPKPAAAPSEKPLALAKAPFVPARLVIRRLDIDAPIEVKGINSKNQMEAPDEPLHAAWYRFTTRPGAGGNAVFSGHLDAESIGPAIFWRLTQLKAGDVIEVVSPESSELRYKVTQSWSYPLASIPMKSVLYPGGGDQITLITCAGHYKPGSGYDHRLVIRATPTTV